jgi:hypothetical protein
MDNPCEKCSSSSGCTERLDEKRIDEEVSGAPILIWCAVAIVVFSLLARWLFS